MQDEKKFVHVDSKRTIGLLGPEYIYVFHPTGVVNRVDIRNSIRAISPGEAFTTLRRAHEKFLANNNHKLQRFLSQNTTIENDLFNKQEDAYVLALEERYKYIFPQRLINLRASMNTQEAIEALTKEIVFPTAYYLVHYHGIEDELEHTSLVCFTNKRFSRSDLEQALQEHNSASTKPVLLPLPPNETVKKIFENVPYQKANLFRDSYVIYWRNQLPF